MLFGVAHNSRMKLQMAPWFVAVYKAIDMDTEIKIWILVGLAGVMATALGFIINIVMGQVIKRLDEIVTELKQLTQATTIQEQQIKGLQDQGAIIHNRLNEHAMRIHTLEIKSDSKNN
jgi:hypothetical protein